MQWLQGRVCGHLLWFAVFLVIVVADGLAVFGFWPVSLQGPVDKSAVALVELDTR